MSRTMRMLGNSCSAAEMTVERTTDGSSAYDGMSTVMLGSMSAKCFSRSARGARWCTRERYIAPCLAIRYIKAEKVSSDMSRT